ncbi:FAD binding domain-containing protein [Granulosicoccus sp. 3-233]|uniref:FAD binding domain-containing protein n=1 Tax=Granulosicoccus sp. 3-233 TaxID=3417969 RepID=UPI003D3531FD
MSIGGSMSLERALEQLSRTPMPILAGGTDFYPALRDAPAPEQVLDVSRIEGLRGIQKTASGYRLGAATTWSDVIAAPLPRVFKALKDAAREVGSVQIQNAGTVAGNLCNASPAADGVPPLLTLNASVELASVRGTRLVALQEFILGPRQTCRLADEIMIAVHIPEMGDTACSEFVKLGARRYLVISIVMASLMLEADEQGQLQEVRVAVGACSAVACRLRQLESVLQGQFMTAELLSLVTPPLVAELAPIDDVRGSAEYRMQVVVQLIRLLLARGMQSVKNAPRGTVGSRSPEGSS